MTTQQITLTAFLAFMVLLGFYVAARRRPNLSDKSPAQYDLELDAQRKTIDFQRKEIARLETLNYDQDKQIRDYIVNGTISKHERDDAANNKRQFDAMKEEMDKLALFIRENKSKEVAMGRHAGKSIADICIMYMGQNEKVVN